MTGDPLPSDGWRSRKVIVCVALLAVLLGVPTGYLAVDAETDLAAWAAAVDQLWPLIAAVVGALVGGVSFDKHIEARRATNGGG